jgi:hypothetical protein
MSNVKQQVKELLRSIETGDSELAGLLYPGECMQHNLAVADGIEGSVGASSQLRTLRAQHLA